MDNKRINTKQTPKPIPLPGQTTQAKLQERVAKSLWEKAITSLPKWSDSFEKDGTAFRIITFLGEGTDKEVFRGTMQTKEKSTDIALGVADEECLEREFNAVASLTESLTIVSQITPIARWEGKILYWQMLYKMPASTISPYTPHKTRANYALHLFKGLTILRAANLQHRDLKLDNLYISQDGVLCIADFGFSTTETTCGPFFEIGKGNVLYTAPEGMFDERTVDSDLWSGGLLMSQLLTPRVCNEDMEGMPVFMKRIQYETAVDFGRAIAYLTQTEVQKYTRLPYTYPKAMLGILLGVLQIKPTDRTKPKTVASELEKAIKEWE